MDLELRYYKFFSAPGMIAANGTNLVAEFFLIRDLPMIPHQNKKIIESILFSIVEFFIELLPWFASSVAFREDNLSSKTTVMHRVKRISRFWDVAAPARKILTLMLTFRLMKSSR